MGQESSIEWTNATWNPLRGCTPVSEGCRNCYAAGQAARYSGPGRPYEGLAQFTSHGPRWTGEVREVPDHLEQPLRWKKPRRIFVNSMSDLFHPAVSDAYIAKVFAVMQAAHWHTFQVLTKRPHRMATMLTDPAWPMRIGAAYAGLGMPGKENGVAAFRDDASLPNVWLGTSVEDQAAADARIPHLLRTPAAIRFLSCEPLLGAVDLAHHLGLAANHEDLQGLLHWVIVGGESGHGARPMDLAWARSLRDQCRMAGVAFFFKQVGARQALTTRKGGDLEEIPEDLRVRDFPEA